MEGFRDNVARSLEEKRAWTIVLPRIDDFLPRPSVGERLLARTISSEVEFKEREGNGPWITQRLRKYSLFLTGEGSP